MGTNKTALPAYADPDHEGNSPAHYSGKPCIVAGCDSKAGTQWGPHWCMKHNIERIERITKSLEASVARFEDRP